MTLEGLAKKLETLDEAEGVEDADEENWLEDTGEAFEEEDDELWDDEGL